MPCPVSYTHLDVYKRQVWNFGNGGASVTGAGNAIFGDGAILACNTGSADAGLAAQYNVNYNNAELVLNALVQGHSNLTHAGTGTLILDQANTCLLYTSFHVHRG